MPWRGSSPEMPRGLHTSEFWLALLSVGLITTLTWLGGISNGTSLSIAAMNITYTLARAALKARGSG